MWCNCSDGAGMLLEKYEGSCFTFRHTLPASTHAACARISWWIIDGGAGRVDVYFTRYNFWSEHRSRTFICNSTFKRRVLNICWIKSFRCQLKKVYDSLRIKYIYLIYVLNAIHFKSMAFLETFLFF